MKKYKTQICLVSGQGLPNVTPVLDENIRPEKVILCVTDSMKINGDVLIDFFTSKKITSEIFYLGNAYEFIELKERFLELAAECIPDTAINLTGGNKLMTIAAQEVFRNDFDMFYVIPERDEIIMISDSSAQLYEIADKVTLEDFFAVYGYKVNNIERKKSVLGESIKLFEKLIPSAEKYAGSLGILNSIAAEAKKRNSLNVKNTIPENSWDMLKMFQDHGAIEYYDDTQLHFKDCESRKFCNGFWFEDYIYLELKKNAEKYALQDFGFSLEIENIHGVKNEIDAAYICNNSLYLIECKTAKMNEKGSDVLYKMDTIQGYAGLFTHGVIISYRKLLQHDLQRAKDLNITVIHGNEINNIEKRLPGIY